MPAYAKQPIRLQVSTNQIASFRLRGPIELQFLRHYCLTILYIVDACHLDFTSLMPVHVTEPRPSELISTDSLKILPPTLLRFKEDSQDPTYKP